MPMLCSISLNKINKVTQLQLKTTKSVSCLNVRVLCYVEVACLEYRPYNYVVACNVVHIGNLNHNHVDLGTRTGFMAESRPGTHVRGRVLGRAYQALIQP